MNRATEWIFLYPQQPCVAKIFIVHTIYEIVWDEQKRQSNLTKHRLDFADLSIDFFAAAKVPPSEEGRSKAIGNSEGVTVIAVAFRPYGSEALSVVSMRRANKAERNLS